MRRFFIWFDKIGQLSPIEQAKKELESTNSAYLEAKTQEEYYMGLSSILETRRNRLVSYINGEI